MCILVLRLPRRETTLTPFTVRDMPLVAMSTSVGYAAHTEEAARLLSRVLQPAFHSLLLSQEAEKELYLRSNPLLATYLH